MGDIRLSNLTTPVTPGLVYYHAGHGAEDVLNAEGKLNLRKVPSGCMYATSTNTGDVTTTVDECDMRFTAMWNGSSIAVKELNKVLVNARLPRGSKDGLTARYFILALFSPSKEPTMLQNLLKFLDPLPKSGTTPAKKLADFASETSIGDETDATISIGGEEFIESYFLPCFIFEDSVMPSGLHPMSPGEERIDLVEEMKVVGGVVTTKHIEFMYRGSVFPTVEEVLGTPELKGVLEEGEGELAKGEKGEYTNYKRVAEIIIDNWLCTSYALMLAFPGSHCHFVCRVPATYSIDKYLTVTARPAADAAKAKMMANVPDKKLDASAVPSILRTDAWKSLAWGGEDPKVPLDPRTGKGKGEKDPDPIHWTQQQRDWAVFQLQKSAAKEVDEAIGKLLIGGEPSSSTRHTSGGNGGRGEGASGKGASKDCDGRENKPSCTISRRRRNKCLRSKSRTRKTRKQRKQRKQST
jgi:hypothetical protein